jgi:hypothetical protein
MKFLNGFKKFRYLELHGIHLHLPPPGLRWNLSHRVRKQGPHLARAFRRQKRDTPRSEDLGVDAGRRSAFAGKTNRFQNPARALSRRSLQNPVAR